MRSGWMSQGQPVVATAPPRPAWPRTSVTADAARLSLAVGQAWRIELDVPAGRAFLEILTPAVFASHAESEKVADAMRGTVLDAREGRLILGVGGLALLCLLGGIPWPMSGGLSKERLRAAAALARLPAPLDALDLSLARLQAPSLSPVYRVLAAVSKARAARDEALVRQRLHARVDDLSCYCEAWAPARVWDTLLRMGSPARIDGAATLPASLIPLRFALVLGRTRAKRGDLAGLRVGDVARLPLWLGADGTGRVRLAGRTVVLRIAGEAHRRAFEIVSAESADATAMPGAPVPFVIPYAIAPSRSHVMNPISDPMNAPLPEPAGDGAATAGSPDARQPGNDLTGLLDAMPVALVAEVGILSLSVATLRSLAPGMLLEIDPHPLGEVVLRTDEGRHLAGGRLVDIDGQLGIQITRLGAA